MSVLVDTSAWIDYFRSGNDFQKLDHLIEEDLVLINDLILAELIPFLKIRKQNKVIKLLCTVKKLSLSINWTELIEYQFICLQNGINGVGTPDLIIAQNAKQNNCGIYSLDNHFVLMKDILDIQLIM